MKQFSGLLILLFASLLYGTNVCAQNSEEQLAAQFYQDKDYDKAVDIYKKLYKKNWNSVYIYENYLNCLIKLEDQKGALEIVNFAAKKSDNNLTFQVDEAYIYQVFGNKNKSEALSNTIISQVAKRPQLPVIVSQYFLKRDMNSSALVLLQTAIASQGVAAYWQFYLPLLVKENDLEKTINLGLNVLLESPEHLDDIYTSFSQAVKSDKDDDYLRVQILSFAQKNPNKEVFTLLLLKHFVTTKKYGAAVKQAIALDKRTNGEGKVVYELGETCLENNAYSEAIDCYKYVLSLGQDKPFAIEAELGLLETKYQKIKNSYPTKSQEVDSLLVLYQKFNEEYANLPASGEGTLRQGELMLFYKNDVQGGIKFLENVKDVPKQRPSHYATLKLMLGDAYLMDGNIWEAQLYYGQVDKDFKEDAFGQEAKFKNAKLSYYTGDFEWAKEQLDILKTATSQLISNNSIELALTIETNTGLDSTTEAMKAFAQADFLFFQNRIDESLVILNRFPFEFSKHSLEDEVLYLKAQIMEKIGKYDAALTLYQSIYTAHKNDILADNALYKAAGILLKVMNKPKEAKDLYEKIILEFTDSLFVVDARKQFNLLNKTTEATN